MENVNIQPTIQYRGLSPTEVTTSRSMNGDNVITPPPPEPLWKMFLSKFEDPVIRILMIAAFVAILVGAVHGDYVEGIGILIAILLATSLAFLNEYRAGQAFQLLNKVNEDQLVQVIRNSQVTTIPRRDVVVGDIVLVNLGQEIPADGFLLEGLSMQVDQKSFTGESVPVSKLAENHPRYQEVMQEESPTTPLHEVWRGTHVADGHGIFQVTRVGNTTELAKLMIASTIEADEDTPLNKQLDRLSKLIGVVGLAMAVLTYGALVARGVFIGELVLTGEQWLFAALLTISVIIGLTRVWLPIVYDGIEFVRGEVDVPNWLEEGGLRGWLSTLGLGIGVFAIGVLISRVLGILPPNPSEWLPEIVGEKLLGYFMIAVTVIVVAVPEGLAMSVTLSLAYAMNKMFAQNCLVRKMNATETAGAATVVCSDKTGTLTYGNMSVYSVEMPVLSASADGANAANRDLVFEGIAVNSTAHLHFDNGRAEVLKGSNLTEGALLLWLFNQEQDYARHRAKFQIEDQATFNAEKKYMATLGTPQAGDKRVVYVKGAPEILLEACTHILTPNGKEPIDSFREGIEASIVDYARRAMRTLGFACFDDVTDEDWKLIKADLPEGRLPRKLTWIGFAAIADQLRAEVPGAVNACHTAGIEVKIVTGDKSETALEVAQQIGLIPRGANHDGAHMTGTEFDNLSDAEAAHIVKNIKVLSRARPAHKLRLVNLLKESGEIVAVTGDGANDAPALNQASIGLAMGSGDNVAKEASDVVIVNDAFDSIVNAVMWGRSLYENIQRFILFQLTINVTALLMALIGPFLGVELPLTVTQMLWVNLIMDTLAALALATEPPHPTIMQRSPRKQEDFIVTPTMWRSIFGVGLIFVAVLVALLINLQGGEGGITTYELSFFFTVFILLQFWNIFNARNLGSNGSALIGVFQNPSFVLIAAVILVGQILIVQVPFLNDVFRTEPLELGHWVLIFVATSVVLWIGEFMRFLSRSNEKREQALA